MREKVRRCEDKKMWRWADVKMSRCEDEQMWRWEDGKVWRWADVKMRGCEDERMWRWADVKMRGCEDEQMWRWEDVKMRCEDEKMFYRPPLLEEPCAQTLSGKKVYLTSMFTNQHGESAKQIRTNCSTWWRFRWVEMGQITTSWTFFWNLHLSTIF